MGIILLFLLLIIGPIYHMSLITWRDDLTKVQTETRNYIDKIIDTSLNTEGYQEDYKLEHFARATNPDGKGGTVTTWMISNDLTNFSKGDIVKITVVQKSYNIFQKISQNMLGMQYVNKDLTFAAMVR